MERFAIHHRRSGGVCPPRKASRLPSTVGRHRGIQTTGLAKAGQQFGSAITISRKCHSYLRQIRAVSEALNFPIRTCALSAPLAALTTLPQLAAQVAPHNWLVLYPPSGSPT